MAGHAGDRETVANGLVHDLPDARRVALSAAARLDMLRAATLRPHLSDPDPGVRYRAIEIAARLDDGHLLVDDLIDVVTEGATDRAEVAAFVLGELDLDDAGRARATAALSRQATGHEDAMCRESAVAALGALGTGLDAILAATSDVATVRRRAVLALAPFEGAAVDEAIEAALGDRDWQVRQAAEDLTGPPTPGVDDADQPDDAAPLAE